MPTSLPRTLSFHLDDEAATVALGREVGAHLPASAVLWLQGELGAGKTTFSRGILQALGHSGAVKSPTYTLVEPYEQLPAGPLYHLDLYRLGDPGELDYLGIWDHAHPSARWLIEWPERGAARLAPPDLRVELVVTDTGREAQITALTEAAIPVLAHLRL